MKITVGLCTLFFILTSFQAEAIQSFLDSIPEEQMESIRQEQEAKRNGSFVMPKVDCPYEEELMAVVNGYSFRYLFPEFDDIYSLDYSTTVSLSLFWLATQNSWEKYPDIDGVHVEDLNEVGRYYFGEDFSYPLGYASHYLAPMADHHNFYYWKEPFNLAWEGPVYLLTDYQELSNDTVAATFLPYTPGIGFGIEGDTYFWGIGLARRTADGIRWSYDLADVIDETYGPGTNYLEQIRLNVPQEELMTVTVTMERQEDGRFIALSSRYN